MRLSRKKQVPRAKTREEVIADLKKNADFVTKMKFIKERFWPALCAASLNIEDASTLLYGFNANLMESFLGFMKEKKVSDLGLDGKLDKESPKYAENQALFDLFLDQSVFEAKEYIEGMRQELETFKRDEMQSRPLSSLKAKWIDEL